jgi:hypothetical protein
MISRCFADGQRLAVRAERRRINRSDATDREWLAELPRSGPTPDGHEDSGHASLLLRRDRYTGTVSYYLCWSRSRSRWRS